MQTNTQYKLALISGYHITFMRVFRYVRRNDPTIIDLAIWLCSEFSDYGRIQGIDWIVIAQTLRNNPALVKSQQRYKRILKQRARIDSMQF